MGTPALETVINDTIAATTRDAEGKLVIPEGTEEAVAYAVRAEIRRRDTQAEYTKNKQALLALEAENQKLAESWEKDAIANLSSADQARLEELKVQDPDAWRAEITELETAKRAQFQEKRTAISQEASQLSELEQRKLQLEEFNTNNPNIVLTDEVIANDVPPRITRKLEAGTISFSEFLTEVSEYLSKGKAIDKGPKLDEQPNLGAVRGTKQNLSSKPESNYSDEIF